MNYGCGAIQTNGEKCIYACDTQEELHRHFLNGPHFTELLPPPLPPPSPARPEPRQDGNEPVPLFPRRKESFVEMIASMPFLTDDAKGEIISQHVREVRSARANGTTLNSDFAVQLLTDTIESMGLHSGDRMVWRKNAAGRWEIWRMEDWLREERA